MFSGESDQMRSGQRYADMESCCYRIVILYLPEVRKVRKVQVGVSDAIYIHCSDHDTHAHTGIA